MSKVITDSLGDLLDSISLDLPEISLSDTSDIIATDSDSPPLPDITPITLPKGEIDPRLKLISHSSRTTLHKCPRKYQLYRLSSQTITTDELKETEQGVTFAYGKAVGVGIQSTMESKSIDQVYIDTFLEWDVDLLDETPRQKKSFWLALFAVQKFIALRDNGFLDCYELVYYQGKPACELSFQVLLPNGFKYRGFIDAVLRHKTTGAILVLENKTSSGNANSAMYKNSGQALGYSVILDSSCSLMPKYCIYKSAIFKPIGK